MVFLSNYLVFKIVLAALGRVDYPVAGDLELKYDNANKIYLSGGSLEYVSNVVLYKGETSYEISESLNVDASNEQILLVDDRDTNTQLGYDCAIDGDYIIGGAPQDDEADSQAGAAYIFKRTNGMWKQTAKLIVSDAAANDQAAEFVNIFGDYAIIGVYTKSSNAGAAYIFKRDTGAETWNQQAKLTASDAAASDKFGNGVSINSDYAIVGSPYNDDTATNSGSAYIFIRSGSSWTQQAKLTASDAASNDEFGLSVDISGDYVISGANSGDQRPGSAYIFKRSGTSWSQQAKIQASDGATSDRFGKAVALSGDYAVIGAYTDDSPTDSGSAYIFKKDTGAETWTQKQKLTASDAATSDNFGWKVDISGDIAIIGAYYADIGGVSNAGAAYIFKRDTGTETWTEVKKLTASTHVTTDGRFSDGVGVSGSTIVVGAAYNDVSGVTHAGALYVYNPQQVTNYYITQPGTYRADLQICGIDYKTNEVEVTGSIVPEKSFPSVSTKTYPSDGGTVSDSDYYGYVGLSGNGLVMVVVGKGDDDTTTDSGGFMVYEKINGVWTFTQQITNVGSGSATLGDCDEGKSVQLDYTGTRVFIGAHADDHSTTNSGSVYIYKRVAQGNWTLEQRIDGGGASYRYGYNDVNNDGDKLIIGSYGYPGSGNVGRAWYYTRSGTTWSLQDELVAPTTSAYGTSVGMNSAGTRAIIGGYNHSSNKGRVDIWNYSGGSWSIGAGFTGENASDKFGWNVDMSNDGNTVVVGAPQYSSGGGEGRAYIYTTSDGTNWSLLKTLSNQTANEQFGFSVQISGDGNTVVIGAAKNDDGVTDGGRSYVYVKTNGTWPSTPTHTIIGTTANSNNGHTLGISDTGETIISGAPFDDDKGTNQGAVYIFDKKEIASLTFDGYNKLSLTNTPTYTSSKLTYGSNVYDIGTLTSDITIEKQGEYASLTFDTSSNVAYFSNVTVGAIASTMAGYEVEQTLYGTAQSSSPSQGGYGNSIDMSADGTRMVVGNAMYTNTNGRVWLYHLENGTWVLKQMWGSGYRLGSQVAMNEAGTRAFVVSPQLDSQNLGFVRIWDYSSGAWDTSASGTYSIAPGTINQEVHGIDCNKTGDVVIIGSGNSSNNTWIYRLSGGSWSSEKNFSRRGSGVSMNGDGTRCFMGDRSSHKVWESNYSGGSWGTETEIIEDTSVSSSYWPSSLSTDSAGETLCIMNNTSGEGAIYERAGNGSWSASVSGILSTTELYGTDKAKISYDGTMALFGHQWNSGALSTGGHALLYTKSGSTWTLTQTLLNPSSSQHSNDFFGSGTGLAKTAKDRFAIGMPGDDTAGTDYGSVHIYTNAIPDFISFDTYNKLSLSGITNPTSKLHALPTGAETTTVYDIGTATNIYIESEGTYTAEMKGSGGFALVSNTTGNLGTYLTLHDNVAISHTTGGGDTTVTVNNIKGNMTYKIYFNRQWSDTNAAYETRFSLKIKDSSDVYIRQINSFSEYSGNSLMLYDGGGSFDNTVLTASSQFTVSGDRVFLNGSSPFILANSFYVVLTMSTSDVITGKFFIGDTEVVTYFLTNRQSNTGTIGETGNKFEIIFPSSVSITDVNLTVEEYNPEPQLNHDGFNKYTFTGADTGSTYKLKYESNTYDLGTISNVYIANPGTYSAEIKGATNFALSSNTASLTTPSPNSQLYYPLTSEPSANVWSSTTDVSYGSDGVTFNSTSSTFGIEFTVPTSGIFTVSCNFMKTSFSDGTGVIIASSTNQNSPELESNFTATSYAWRSTNTGYRNVTGLTHYTNRWYHMVWVHDKNKGLAAYIDGIRVYSYGGTITSPQTSFIVGPNYRSGTITNRFGAGGKMSDIRIYETAISPTEAELIYKADNKYIPSLTFDGYNKLTFTGLESGSTSNVTFDGNTYSIGTASNVYIENTGTYEAESKGTTTFALTKNVVGAIASKSPVTVAFHFNTFSWGGDPYSDGSVTAAATAGHIYSDTPTGTYTWGSLDSASTASQQTTYTWTPASTVTAKVLMVAGGGGGGNSDNGNGGGGGGGAGGVVYNSSVSLSGQQTITVGGNNSAVRGDGVSTTFTGLTTAFGGGKGAGSSGGASAGGSGGGAFRNGTGGAGTSGQGYAGGNGSSTYSPWADQGGSGGGGAGGSGADATGPNGANGGIGLDYSSVFGTTYGDSGWFASGGGGGFHSGSPGTASNGGGTSGGATSGSTGATGQKHTGGGGGGGSIASGPGSYGGSGIVLVQIPPASPSLTHDGYKLVVKNITPTSTTLKYGSNTYEIGTATNIYVENTGDYSAEIGGAADFAFTSNTVSGTIKTIEPGFASRYQGSMALTYDGKLYAWGMNDDGEAGVGTSSDITVPTLCTGITQGTVAKLLSGSDITDNSRGEVSAIKTTDGKIYMAGKGDNYCIPGETGDSTSFTDVTSYFGDQSLTANTITMMSFTDASGAALTETGNVWTWGTHDSTNKRLGQASASTSSTPKQINFSSATGIITKITCGTVHSLALDSSGDVWFWGKNTMNSTSWPSSITDEPQKVVDGKNIIGLASSHGTMYAWDATGKMWNAGNNWEGQIGDGTTTANTTGKTLTEVTYFSSNGITINKVYAGGYSVFADTSDGYYCWGNGSYGVFGNGGTGNITSGPAKWTNVSNIKKFMASTEHTTAITEDGKYYAWGRDYHGGRGDSDSSSDITYPKYIDTLPNILAPSFDYDGYDKVFVNKDGGIKTWTSGPSYIDHIPGIGSWDSNSFMPLYKVSDDGVNAVYAIQGYSTSHSIKYTYATKIWSDNGSNHPDYVTSNTDDPTIIESTPNAKTLVAMQNTGNIFYKFNNPFYSDSFENTKYTKGTTTYDVDKASIITVSDPGTYDAQLKSKFNFTLKSATVPATKASGLYTWAFHHGNFDNAYGDGDILTARDNGRFYADTPSYTGDIGTITAVNPLVSSNVSFRLNEYTQNDSSDTNTTGIMLTEIDVFDDTNTAMTYGTDYRADLYRAAYADNLGDGGTGKLSDETTPYNDDGSRLNDDTLDGSGGYIGWVNGTYNASATGINRKYPYSVDDELIRLVPLTGKIIGKVQFAYKGTGTTPGWKVYRGDNLIETTNYVGTDINTQGNQTTHQIADTVSSTTYTFTPASTLTANVLMVAGGAGGGGRYSCGGGGAGGLVYTAGTSLANGATKTIVVGNGDSGGNGDSQNGFTGKNTTFTDLTPAVGGGYGGTQGTAGGTGGSGGGGGGQTGNGTGGSATSGQGNAGGTGSNSGSFGGAGGGGAGAAGGNGSNGVGGNGGIGKFFGTGSSFTNFGDEYGEGGYFAGGAGGGTSGAYAYGIPGRGGGGYGAAYDGYMSRGGSQHGMVHTGGGGGGGSTPDRDQHPGYASTGDGGVTAHGGRGGSGIVLIQTNVALPNGANTAVVQVGNPRRRSLPPAVSGMGSEVNRFYIIDSASMPTYKLPTHWYVDPISSNSDRKNDDSSSKGKYTIQTRADGGTSNVWYALAHDPIYIVATMPQTLDAVFMPVEKDVRYDMLLKIGGNDANDIQLDMGSDGTAKLYKNWNNDLIASSTEVCFTVGKWHHIALTVDSGGNAVGYVNGYPVVSGTYTSVATVGTRSVNTFFRCGDANYGVTFRKHLTYECSTYNFLMTPKQVMQRAAEVGLGPKLEYDGLNAINVVNTEPGSGTEITIYESNVNDTSNLYVVSCNESSYLLSNAGTYYAQIKGTDTFTITRPLTVTDDHFPLYAYPPRDGTQSSITTTTTADTWNTWTISGASNGNGQYQARSNRTATGTRNVYKAFSNNIGTGGAGEFQPVHSSGQHETGTIDLQLPSAKTIRKYVIWTTDSAFYTYNSTTYTDYDPTLPYNGSERSKRRIKSWTIQGSNSGTSWTTIHTVTNKPPSIYGDVHTISSPGSYQYYRLNWSENNGSTETTTVAELIYWGDA